MKTKPNKEIDILLERFENGETTRVEEKRLKELLQLEENEVHFEVIKYLDEVPSIAELGELLKMLNLKPIDCKKKRTSLER
jgi:hypothetical protein